MYCLLLWPDLLLAAPAALAQVSPAAPGPATARSHHVLLGVALTPYWYR